MLDNFSWYAGMLVCRKADDRTVVSRCWAVDADMTPVIVFLSACPCVCVVGLLW